MNLPKTAKEARETNSLYYFTGKPCKRGHISKRVTKKKMCYRCDLDRVMLWQQNNRDKVCATMQLYRKRHPNYNKTQVSLRRARIKNAIPIWANLEKIKDFYRFCPVGYEVDHIIPLRGKYVSGLHVEGNLQYLSKTENRSKSNKF